jgi:hypothetical protein
MLVTYCQSWSRAKKRINQIWSEEKALKAHQEGEVYTAVIGLPEKPNCFLEINIELKFVGVNFLDENLRDYLHYSFFELESRALFINQVIYREYRGDTDLATRAIITQFNPDGKTKIRDNDLIKDECKVNEFYTDIKKNWEDIPEFGQYESIIRFDRNL